MKILVPEKSYEVPDGELCESFDRGTKLKRCKFCNMRLSHISDREAQSSGLGVSGGTLTFYDCKLFREALRDEDGVGVFKCKECKKNESR